MRSLGRSLRQRVRETARCERHLREVVRGQALFGKKTRPASGLKLAGENAFASIEHRIDGGQIRIGAAPGNDLILSHPSVSARHAMIRRKLGRYQIRDLGSTNGTFLNGQRIDAEQPLRPGDSLRFGAARFTIAGREEPVSSIMKYGAAAFGLIVLAGVGYLAVTF